MRAFIFTIEVLLLLVVGATIAGVAGFIATTHVPSTLESIALNIACINPNTLPSQAQWECFIWQKIGRIPDAPRPAPA
jgi:hypothetical protein